VARRGGLRRPPYGYAVALCEWAIANWPAFDGSCASSGVDPFDLTARRLCHLIYSTLTANADEKQRNKVDRILEARGKAAEATPQRRRAPAVRIPSEAEMYAAAQNVTAFTSKFT
jgi:hypothetical protein